jgi:hypothetical protein
MPPASPTSSHTGATSAELLFRRLSSAADRRSRKPVPDRDNRGDWEKLPYASPNEVMIIGTLEGGGLFAVQLEGAQRHPTGLQIDITGTDDVLRITNPRGFEKKTTTPSRP